MAFLPHAVTLPNGFCISDERARLDMAFVHASLAQAYWAVGRSPALTERCWSHCLCFGIYDPAGPQVGFGRILTDYSLRAHIGDVFVHPASRRRGLAHALIRTMLEHPELATVTHWTLSTTDAHAVYRPFGFRVAGADERWMTLTRAA